MNLLAQIEKLHASARQGCSVAAEVYRNSVVFGHNMQTNLSVREEL